MTDPIPPKSLDETFRQYAWDYFALHADHRLRAFHFYILISGALTGVFATIVSRGEFHRWMAALGALLMFFSFVFWKMDVRTRQLVKNAENALKFLDEQHGLENQGRFPHALRLFSRESEMSAVMSRWSWNGGHFNYERCFRWVFAMFGLVGLAIVIASGTLAGGTTVSTTIQPPATLPASSPCPCPAPSPSPASPRLSPALPTPPASPSSASASPSRPTASSAPR